MSCDLACGIKINGNLIGGACVIDENKAKHCVCKTETLTDAMGKQHAIAFSGENCSDPNVLPDGFITRYFHSWEDGMQTVPSWGDDINDQYNWDKKPAKIIPELNCKNRNVTATVNAWGGHFNVGTPNDTMSCHEWGGSCKGGAGCAPEDSDYWRHNIIPG